MTRLRSETSWSEIWSGHLETYLSQPPRCGYWLASRFPRALSVLEIAGGSCRDSGYLASLDFNVTASDFDQKTIDYLRNHYQSSSMTIRREDAFRLSIADKSMDLSFSNGLWVYFDDKKISLLINEQERVTRRFLIALVHNIENTAMVARFRGRSKVDKLYDIRFFHREELRKIIGGSNIRCKSVTMYKFGGPMDIFLAKSIRGISNGMQDIAKRIVPRTYHYQPWSLTERIACVVELE